MRRSLHRCPVRDQKGPGGYGGRPHPACYLHTRPTRSWTCPRWGAA